MLAQGPARRLPGRRRQDRSSRTARTTTSIARTWRSDLRPRNCFRETFLKMKPALLEPIMKVEIEVPEAVPGHGGRQHLISRRGIDHVAPRCNGNVTKIIAEVPLAETFGYSTDLRIDDARARARSRWSSPSTARCRATSRRKSSPSGRRSCSRRSYRAVSRQLSAISENKNSPRLRRGFFVARFRTSVRGRACGGARPIGRRGGSSGRRWS